MHAESWDSPSGSAETFGGMQKIFVGAHGLRAGWRFALFVALLAILRLVIIQHGLHLIPGFVAIAKTTQDSGVLTPAFQLMLESAAILTAFLSAGIMAWIEKRSFASYGLPRRSAFGKLFWQGVIGGLTFETIEILVIRAFGGFSFGSLALAGGAVVRFAIVWAIGFLLVGIFGR